MGVKGLTSLLREQQLLPEHTSASASLWRSSRPNSKLARDIRPRSTFAVDGNGLVFFLHRVAYARHVEHVLGGSTSTLPQTGGSPPTAISHLPRQVVSSLLPTFLSLSILEKVTEEFVGSLRKHQIKIVVYWDGEWRRGAPGSTGETNFKAWTEIERQKRRDQEWTNLNLYFQQGKLPGWNINHLAEDFPMNGLVKDQVMQKLVSFDIPMIFCKEEADAHLARGCVLNSETFVLGLDSDFCLFRGCRYVPLDTLHVSARRISGCVITRPVLAKELGFSDEDALVTKGMRMGNDYLKSGRDQQDNSHSVVQFVRDWYNLENLDQYPLTKNRKGKAKLKLAHFILNDSPDSKDVDALGCRLGLAACLKDSESTLAGALRRVFLLLCNFPSASPCLHERHVDVFFQVYCNADPSDGQPVFPDVCWEDVRACHIIERCISLCLSSNKKSGVFKGLSPANVFSHSQFLSRLGTAAFNQNTTAGLNPHTAANSDRQQLKSEEPSAQIEETADPTQQSATTPNEIHRNSRLPIDEHEERILDEIRGNRLTFIHGETGCGKSSRIPAMLFGSSPPDSSVSKVKFFFAIPRRIAVKSLVERLRSNNPDIKDLVALRMGDGVREYESKQTRAWFVTTGYLARYLANNDHVLADHSHLIIDEVHERTVDADILCLLCRRILQKYDHIRIILMSATLADSLATYFGIDRPPIYVGARPFEIKEIFVEDLENLHLRGNEKKTISSIMKYCSEPQRQSGPTEHYMKGLLALAAQVTLIVGLPGSSVLIFVPGMLETVSLGDLIVKLKADGKRFTFVPIHSDIPFEVQMLAFEEPARDEVKVIVATNAAESGITLPHVDHVICLGLSKQIRYNEESHRQKLVMRWISKSSAKQRAGRTGRLRPGKVYRLYTRQAYEYCMDEFEPGEMVHTPLDQVILHLKDMLQEEVQPVLLSCIEPPLESTIKRSFQSLRKGNFLTKADETGKITLLGFLALAAGIDLALGSLIGLGIQFGVGAEALEVAAILSFAKSPWISATSSFHSERNYNVITSKSFVSRCHFDANLYSEPLAIMNLIWDFERAPGKEYFCWSYNVSLARMQQLIASRDTIRHRVSRHFRINSKRLAVEQPPVLMPHAKVVILRVIQVWVFADTIAWKKIKPNLVLCPQSGDVIIPLRGDSIQEEHFELLLSKERHPFRLGSRFETCQQGSFSPAGGTNFDMKGFEKRFLSLAVERDCEVAFYSDSRDFLLFAREALVDAHDNLFRSVGLTLDGAIVGNPNDTEERSCWSFDIADDDTVGGAVRLARFKTIVQPDPAKVAKKLASNLKKLRYISCNLGDTGLEDMYRFSITTGNDVALSDKEMFELFSSSEILTDAPVISPVQEISFQRTRNKPLAYPSSSKFATSVVNPSSSWERPLINDDIPEGARLLSALARRESRDPIRLQNDDDEENAVVRTISFGMNRPTGGWKRFGGEGKAAMKEHSVPACVIPMRQDWELFICCANTLEVEKMGIVATGLTLLPPGRLFLVLSLLAFGLSPLSGAHLFEDEESFVEEIMRWECCGLENIEGQMIGECEKRLRIASAVKFNKSCSQHLGEELVCYPSYVRQLCKLFDGVDGFQCEAWHSLDDNLFVSKEQPPAHGSALKHDQVSTQQVSGIDTAGAALISQSAEMVSPSVPPFEAVGTPPFRNDGGLELQDLLAGQRKLVSAAFPLHSLVIFEFLYHRFCSALIQHKNVKGRDKVKVAQNKSFWRFQSLTMSSGKKWVRAEFVTTIYLPRRKIPKAYEHKYPSWMCAGKDRPDSTSDALHCIPTHVNIHEAEVPHLNSTIQKKALFFENVEIAKAMEAAFWLCKQLHLHGVTWYTQPLHTMDVKLFSRVKNVIKSNSWNIHQQREWIQVRHANHVICASEGGNFEATNLRGSLHENVVECNDLTVEVSKREDCQTPIITVSILAYLIIRAGNGQSENSWCQHWSHRHWSFYSTVDCDGKKWIRSEFDHEAFPLRVVAREAELPGWMKAESSCRPTSLAEARLCIPFSLRNDCVYAAQLATEGKVHPELFFDSIDLAMEMEAGFWLSRQLQSKSRAWYRIAFDQLEVNLMRLKRVSQCNALRPVSLKPNSTDDFEVGKQNDEGCMLDGTDDCTTRSEGGLEFNTLHNAVPHHTLDEEVDVTSRVTETIVQPPNNSFDTSESDKIASSPACARYVCNLRCVDDSHVSSPALSIATSRSEADRSEEQNETKEEHANSLDCLPNNTPSSLARRTIVTICDDRQSKTVSAPDSLLFARGMWREHERDKPLGSSFVKQTSTAVFDATASAKHHNCHHQGTLQSHDGIGALIANQEDCGERDEKAEFWISNIFSAGESGFDNSSIPTSLCGSGVQSVTALSQKTDAASLDCEPSKIQYENSADAAGGCAFFGRCGVSCTHEGAQLETDSLATMSLPDGKSPRNESRSLPQQGPRFESFALDTTLVLTPRTFSPSNESRSFAQGGLQLESAAHNTKSLWTSEFSPSNGSRRSVSLATKAPKTFNDGSTWNACLALLAKHQNRFMSTFPIPSVAIVSFLLSRLSTAHEATELEMKTKMGPRIALRKEHWRCHAIIDECGKDWFRAEFSPVLVSFLQTNVDFGDTTPDWIKSKNERPRELEDAMQCIPMNSVHVSARKFEVAASGSSPESALFFESVEIAIVDRNGRQWIRSEFALKGLALPVLHGRGQVPDWLSSGMCRPGSFADADSSFPLALSKDSVYEARVLQRGSYQQSLFFENLEVAIGVESSFWLSRYFHKDSKPWFERSLSDMEAELMEMLTWCHENGASARGREFSTEAASIRRQTNPTCSRRSANPPEHGDKEITLRAGHYLKSLTQTPNALTKPMRTQAPASLDVHAKPKGGPPPVSQLEAESSHQFSHNCNVPRQPIWLRTRGVLYPNKCLRHWLTAQLASSQAHGSLVLQAKKN